jgi:hypothetical protein
MNTALREAQKKYNDKKRARYRAQPLEHRLRFTLLGLPRKAASHNPALSTLILKTTKYRNLSQVRTAVRQGEITRESLPIQLQHKIPAGTGLGFKHKKQYGESLIEMGKRLGISREAVRLRILRSGSPELKPPQGRRPTA